MAPPKLQAAAISCAAAGRESHGFQQLHEDVVLATPSPHQGVHEGQNRSVAAASPVTTVAFCCQLTRVAHRHQVEPLGRPKGTEALPARQRKAMNALKSQGNTMTGRSGTLAAATNVGRISGKLAETPRGRSPLESKDHIPSPTRQTMGLTSGSSAIITKHHWEMRRGTWANSRPFPACPRSTTQATE